MIKAVIFDVDGVLADSKVSNRIFLQNLIVKSGYKMPTRKMTDSVHHLTMRDAVKVLSGVDSEQEAYRIWEMGRNRSDYPMHLMKIPKGSEEIVKKLSKKYRLGIVTGRIKEGIESLFDKSKTREYFEVIVGFEDYKNPKPHPEPILIALDRLKIKREEAVYVGDSDTDIIAAKEAGVHFILYGRKKDGIISAETFAQIPKLVEALG